MTSCRLEQLVQRQSRWYASRWPSEHPRAVPRISLKRFGFFSGRRVSNQAASVAPSGASPTGSFTTKKNGQQRRTSGVASGRTVLPHCSRSSSRLRKRPEFSSTSSQRREGWITWPKFDKLPFPDCFTPGCDNARPARSHRLRRLRRSLAPREFGSVRPAIDSNRALRPAPPRAPYR